MSRAQDYDKNMESVSAFDVSHANWSIDYPTCMCGKLTSRAMDILQIFSSLEAVYM
jgi:hypothetical protein